MSEEPSNKQTRSNGQFAVVIALALFGVVFLLLFDDQTKWFRRVKWFGQPALWAWMSVVGMTLVGAIAVVQQWVRNAAPDSKSEYRFWMRACEYPIWFLFYAFSIQYVGYLLATILFTSLLGYRIGWRSRRQIAVTVAFAIAVVLAFRTGAGVSFPSGALYEYLPDGLRNFMLTYF